MENQAQIHSLIRDRMHSQIHQIEDEFGPRLPDGDIEFVVADFVAVYFEIQNAQKEKFCSQCGRGGVE